MPNNTPEWWGKFWDAPDYAIDLDTKHTERWADLIWEIILNKMKH